MNKLKVLVLSSLVALVAFTGCQNPINPGQGGILTVSMNDAVSRSILPGISMNPASYDLAGTGPNGASFNQSVSSGSIGTITDLAFGVWTVTATAKNAAGTAIGQGSGSVTVLSNASVNLAITVRPYDGLGTLALDVSWPAAQVQTVQIQSSLTPATGTARNLSFNMNGSAGTASFSASDVATGYHTLILKLLDNGHLAIGAVEVVRIVKDQTTSGTMAFANVNQATGTLEVNLTPEMADPLEVSISGSTATKPANQSLALSASVSNYADNVTYVWYVNGDATATGANYSFDNTWIQGYYRIDVTAFSADGKRAGSATSSVQVTNVNSEETETLDITASLIVKGTNATDSSKIDTIFYQLANVSNNIPVWEPVALIRPGEQYSVNVTITGNDQSLYTFQVAIDDSNYANCSSFFTSSFLDVGRHLIRVKIIENATGNYKKFLSYVFVYSYDPPVGTQLSPNYGGDFVVSDGTYQVPQEPNSIIVESGATLTIYGRNFCIHTPGLETTMQIQAGAFMFVKGSNVNSSTTQNAYFELMPNSVSVVTGSSFNAYIGYREGAIFLSSSPLTNFKGYF